MRQMNSLMLAVTCVLSAVLFPNEIQSQTKPWVTGYVTSWDLNMGTGSANYGNTPYQSIDLDAMTHVVMFAVSNNANGTLNATLDWDGTTKYGTLLAPHRRYFNDYVHSKSKPILITFFGTGGGGAFSQAISVDSMRTALIANMMTFLRTEQYDGFDLDIEPLADGDKANFTLFVKWLADSLSKGKAYYNPAVSLMLTCATYNNPELFGSLSQYFNQVNVMSYDIMGDWWGLTWHNNPVYAAPNDLQVGTTNQLSTVSNRIPRYVSAGVPRSKLGVGIDFNGYIWKGGLLSNGNGVTAPRQQWIAGNPPAKTQFNETRYYDLKKTIDTSTVTLHYDNIAKVPYIGIDKDGNANDLFITFQDESTVTNIIKVVRDSSIGGVILWEINGGYLNSTKFPDAQYPNLVRDPFLQAVKRAMTAAPDTTPRAPEGTFYATPSILPSGGGSVTLTWTSSSATSAFIDQAIGSVTVNGSTTVTVFGDKTFTLTLSNAVGSTNYSASVNVAAAPVSDAMPIYTDQSLNNPWKDVKSWSVTRDYSSTATVYDGSTSLKVVHNAWGSLQFTEGTWGSFATIDPSQYASVDFAVNGGANGVTLKISCVNASNQNLQPALTVNVPPDTWINQSIPMSQLATVPFTALAMTAGGATVTFYLDAIHLVPTSVLPVELTGFEAISKTASAELHWNTATESNNSGFDIERKGNDNAANNWTRVGFVKGNGTSNTAHRYVFEDKNLSPGRYSYRLKQLDTDGRAKYSRSIEVTIANTPWTAALSQNYPNPFNPTTEINYRLAAANHITLKIYDVVGKEVATIVDEEKQAGDYSATFDASGLASGIYIARLQSGSSVELKRMVLMK